MLALLIARSANAQAQRADDFCSGLNSARSWLQGLARQFPNNRLYVRELAQLR